MAFQVGVYLVDRAYGGPEEGGWWYTRGDLSREHGIRNCEDRDAALDRKREVEATLVEDNRGRPPISSMTSRGRFEAYIFEGRLPESFPEETPHYE